MMDARAEIREFLVSRRARLTPADVGLPTYGQRRVPGLRREEVAVLAGISVPYYARLERGDMSKASPGVLEALARALRLDEAERAHLFDLARARARAAPAAGDASTVRPVIRHLVDAVTGAAAFVGNDRLDVLAANSLGRVLCPGIVASGNLARFALLDAEARTFFRDWESAAASVVADLRAATGRHPRDQRLTGLIGELADRSEEFRARWADHDVTLYRSGVKRIHHPLVGGLELNYEQLDLPADPRMIIFTFSAAPDTPAAEALTFLASWSSVQTRQS
jgi:transcriptional regulator with XRE-family HTH domain